MPLLVVRHARAGRRSAYAGDDRERPLSPRGRAQAEGLVPLLSPFRPRRILSSPAVRCFATVQPLSEVLGVPIESVDELGEGNGAEAMSLLERMAGETAVISTHGDVADEMLEALAGDLAADALRRLRLLKGEVWVVRSTGSRLEIVDHLRQEARR